MDHDRRSILAAIGLGLPFGIGHRVAAAAASRGSSPELRFRSFEDGVREAFSGPDTGSSHRIEVGHSDLLRTGIQGCHNDRPFAGFPAKALRIIRTGSEPGPLCNGVRLYVCTVDVILSENRSSDAPGRPLDFALLPPAPVLATGVPDPVVAHPDRARRPVLRRGGF